MNIERHPNDPGIDPLNYDFNQLLKIYEDYEPVGWGILVRVYQPIIQEKTQGGLYLPDTALDHEKHRNKFYTFIGLVIKMGQGVYKDQDRYNLTGDYCAPGDWVQFSRADGNTFAWQGLTSIRLEEDRILAKIKDPKKIAPLSSQLY